MQQSSMISQSGVDASGRPLRGEAKMVAKRISVWDKRDQLKDQKTVMIANMEISRLSDILKINNTVKQRGAEIFRECFFKIFSKFFSSFTYIYYIFFIFFW